MDADKGLTANGSDFASVKGNNNAEPRLRRTSCEWTRIVAGLTAQLQRVRRITRAGHGIAAIRSPCSRCESPIFIRVNSRPFAVSPLSASIYVHPRFVFLSSSPFAVMSFRVHSRYRNVE